MSHIGDELDSRLETIEAFLGRHGHDSTPFNEREVAHIKSAVARLTDRVEEMEALGEEGFAEVRNELSGLVHDEVLSLRRGPWARHAVGTLVYLAARDLLLPEGWAEDLWDVFVAVL